MGLRTSLDRSIPAVRMKAGDLGIYSQTTKHWTDEEMALMKKYYPKRGATYVGQLTGRSLKSVIAQAIRSGFRRTDFHPWQEWEERYLKRYYGTKPARSVGRTLGRSAIAVQIHARLLGLGKPASRGWSNEERDTLRKIFPDLSVSYDKMVRVLNRPFKGILKQARKLGLERQYANRWTPEKRKFLMKNYKHMTHREIAQRLNVTERSVAHYASRYGFRRQPNQRKWTIEEGEYLRAHLTVKSPAEIAQVLHRGIFSIRGRMQALGLHPTAKRSTDNSQI